MELIDLHVHTDYSDGTLSPRAVVSLALSKGLKAIAITDHDTVDGCSQALCAAASTSLEVIAGAELSCMYKNKEIHILGLFLDWEASFLGEALKNQREKREERNLKLLELFAGDGMVFSLCELTGDNPGTVITRAHFARVLVKKGYAKTLDQAFGKYLGQGKKYFLPKEAFAPEEALRLILDAGGFPVIAHPMLYRLGDRETYEMIAWLKSLGLLGVEVYYSSHQQYESMKLLKLCRQLSLLPTGGSDFHGSNKPDIELGSGRGGLRVPRLLLEDIKADRENRRQPSLLRSRLP